MSTVYFYDRIVALESVHVEIDRMKIDPSERVRLRALLEDQVRYAILNMILSELPADARRQFLDHHENQQHDQIWELLNEKIDQVEDKIQAVSKDIVTQLHADMGEL